MPRNDRYSRQVKFGPIGASGQKRIGTSRVALVGLGALGTVVADQLVRGGVGFLRLIDRDFVELSNLQRQCLFDEDDARGSLPKAVAAEGKLRRSNSSVELESVVDDLNPSNVEDYIGDVDLVLDGLDNFETRFVLNDACARTSRPWVYAAAVGSYGVSMPIIPGQTPCLRCLLGTLPAPGSSPTCETAGVLAAITHVIASVEVSQALRVLTGQLDPSSVRLVTFDVWSLRFQAVEVTPEMRAACVLCSEGRLEYLDAAPLRTVTLCGRNAVQLIPATKAELDLLGLSSVLRDFGAVEFNDFLLRCHNPPYELTLFRDGRAIIKGTEDTAVARSVYSRMVGW